MESDGVADHPNPDDVGVSDTESVGGASSASASEESSDIVEPSLVLRDVRENSREMMAALVALDAVDLGTMFARRAVVMKSVPHFLRGAYRGAMRIAMEEATQPDLRRSERGWKLFLLLPRMLLHRPGRGGNISKTKLTSHFDDFSAGRWDVLISASEACDIGAIVDRARRRRHRWCSWASSPVVVRRWKGLMWHLALNGHSTCCGIRGNDQPTPVQGTSCRVASQNSFLSFHSIWMRRNS